MALETRIKLCVTESDFLAKFFFAPKLGKRVQNRPKASFFQFIGKFGH